jgi:hypothetical protein
MPCHNMWCDECYSTAPTMDLYVNRLESKGGESEKDPRDRVRLEKAWGNKRRPPDAVLRARDGDHTMALFECDSCVFHKLHGVEVNPLGHCRLC